MTRIQNDLTRLTSVGVRPVDNSGFTNGFNLDYLINDVANYWMKNFNWRKQEQLLNDVMPQFKTQIDGLDVHFAHIKPNAKLSKGKKILPLLIVHGWPGKCKSEPKKYLLGLTVQWHDIFNLCRKITSACLLQQQHLPNNRTAKFLKLYFSSWF